MNSSNSIQEELFGTLGKILSSYKTDRLIDEEKWKCMSEESRYGLMIQLGVHPMDADKYCTSH